MSKEHKLRLKLGYSIIANIIENNATVLDLGCGNGNLLKKLIKEKGVKGFGIEISQKKVISAIEKGLSVIQGDIDEGLNFSQDYFDWVILNQTLQSCEKPDFVLQQMLEVGKKVIVSFPNFAYWKVRFYLFFKGRMPKSKKLPFEWYNTPNIHLVTIRDFNDYCCKKGIKIQASIFINENRVFKSKFNKIFANFLAEEVIFVLSK